MNDPGAVAQVRWSSPRLHSTELCRLYRRADGWELHGEVDIPLNGAGTRLTYSVATDARWRTRTVRVTADRGRLADQPLQLTVRGDDWLLGDQPRADLHGCTDVDLGFSPATNTLPIRRLGLPVGTSAPVAAAWVTFPDLTVQRLEQRYEHLGDRQWRYRSGNFSAELLVDEHALLRRYGDGIWSVDPA